VKPADFKLWQDRLRFAKGVWTDRGLIGDGKSTMRLLIELNRGDQWKRVGQVFGDLQEEFYATANRVFPIANSIKGDVAARNPQAQMFPNQPEAVKIAAPVEHLINYDIRELNFKRQTNRALDHHLFGPFGAVRHGFTPKEEFQTDNPKRPRRMQLYRPAKPDRPWIKAVKPWDILMDPTQDSFHVDDGMWWVAFRNIMWLEDIYDNPNMISRDKLGDYAGNVKPDWVVKTQEFENNTDPDKEKYVEVWTVYESRERTWFQITLDGLDNTLRERDDWPIDWETLPVSLFQANEQMDTPFSMAIMDEIAPLQLEMNRLRTMMGQLVFRLIQTLGINTNKMDPNEMNKLEDAAIHELIKFNGDPKDAIAIISSGIFPGQDLLQFHALLDEDMRQISGQGKMGRAERINVETAEEAANVQRGQDVNTARIADSYEDFNKDAIRLYMQGRRSTMEETGAEVVRIVGAIDADGMQEWATVEPAHLHGDYELHVVHGSTRKRDKAAEAQAAAADLQVAMATPDMFNNYYFARKYLEARGHAPEQALSKQALIASAVRTLDQVRRNAQTGEEEPASPGFDAGVAALTGATPEQAPAGPNGGGSV
jgi:hypothetical protein